MSGVIQWDYVFRGDQTIQMYGGSESGQQPLVDGFAVVVYLVHESIYPQEAESLSLCRFPHKTEAVEREGLLWHHHACRSNRIATTIVDKNHTQPKQKPKQKGFYACLGDLQTKEQFLLQLEGRWTEPGTEEIYPTAVYKKN